MSLLFQTAGILTTLQDLGRRGFRRFGINPNGAMDADAVRLINILLGNAENTGVLEMHFPAPSLRFETNAVIALGGAGFAAHLNKAAIENWRLITIQENDVVSFKNKNWGARLYLAVRGGFAVKEWLNSQSTNLKAQAGGFFGRPLRAGDRLFFKEKVETPAPKLNYKISCGLIPPYSRSPKIRVVPGAEWDKLTAPSQNVFLTNKFTIKNESDRMGFRLAGENLCLHEKLELVSAAVDFGTMQLLPDGQMIILMADHQTTGGYPRIAHVIQVDLPVLGQLAASDTVNFQMTTIEEAEELCLKREIELNYLRAACKFKF